MLNNRGECASALESYFSLGLWPLAEVEVGE